MPEFRDILHDRIVPNRHASPLHLRIAIDGPKNGGKARDFLPITTPAVRWPNPMKGWLDSSPSLLHKAKELFGKFAYGG
jgi:hypothetical protein